MHAIIRKCVTGRNAVEIFAGKIVGNGDLSYLIKRRWRQDQIQDQILVMPDDKLIPVMNSEVILANHVTIIVAYVDFDNWYSVALYEPRFEDQARMYLDDNDPL